MSQKDDEISKLSDKQLLGIARSIQGDNVGSDMSRNDLTKIVKGSLSLEEIKQRSQKTKSSLSQQRGSGIGVSVLKFAAAAQIFLVVWSIALLLVYLIDEYIVSIATFNPSVASSQPQIEGLLNIAASLFLIVFALLNLGAMIKMRSALSGNRLGVTGGLISLFASLTGTINYVSEFLGLNTEVVVISPAETYQEPSLLGIIVPNLYQVLLVSAMLLVGLFFLLNRKHFLDDDLWFATGMIYLLAASAILIVAYITYFMEVVEYSSLLLVGGAMGAACFMSQK